MPQKDALGTRIRDRRIDLAIKQADLARDVGISASYLNLIEHNRRRIGGKLLNDIAERLNVDPTILSEGAEAALLSRLRLAASELATEVAVPEIDRLAEFAGRFPGWASFVDQVYHRMRGLEAQVENLSDRLAHDADLSASLHEVLTTTAAIRSTADILAESEDIDLNWRRRFHQNIQEEAHRLSDGSQALVAYLDRIAEQRTDTVSATEALGAWLSQQGYHIPALEEGQPISAVLAQIEKMSKEVRPAFQGYLQGFAQDATSLPLPVLLAAIEVCGLQPLALSQHLNVDLCVVLRRLAVIPDMGQPWEIGRVACDGAGFVSFRKPISGFLLPRHGAACPLWPLFRALMQPNMPVDLPVMQLGQDARAIRAFAYAKTSMVGPAGSELAIEAQMIMIAEHHPKKTAQIETFEVGQSCLICPRVNCPTRRERSVFAD